MTSQRVVSHVGNRNLTERILKYISRRFSQIEDAEFADNALICAISASGQALYFHPRASAGNVFFDCLSTSLRQNEILPRKASKLSVQSYI